VLEDAIGQLINSGSGSTSGGSSGGSGSGASHDGASPNDHGKDLK
jgi:hypothetical protein